MMNREGRGLYRRYVIETIAIVWALFQLSLPRFIILDSIFIRSAHLAFAIMLVYIGWATGEGAGRGRLLLLTTIAIVAAVCSLYVVLDWQGISARSGRPITRDIIISMGTVILLLIAAWRAIGMPMTIITICFTLYAFLGPYMPGILAYRGVTFSKYINQVVLSHEGIFGIPLDVSSNTVYLFVLFGALLSIFGAGQFFNDLAIALLGRFKGGPAKAAVVSSGLTGLISGSSIANVVTTGTFTIPLMKKVGYPGTVAAATEVAASTNGQLMPPIMGAAAFIIAEYLGVGYNTIIRAAVIPAFVSYVALFYLTHLEATRLNMHGLPQADVPSIVQVLRNGWYHLLPIAVLIFYLMVLRRSPKMAAFNAIVALAIIVGIQRYIVGRRAGRPVGAICSDLLDNFRRGLVSGSMNMLPVALATATAGIIVGVVNTGIGSLLVDLVEVLSLGNLFLLLFITAIASIILGMGLPTTATYIVMASLTVPLITMLGGATGVIIPAIAAHLFCFYFGILADDTPPVGLAAHTAAAIAGSKPFPTGVQGFIYDLRTAVIPFMFVVNSELVLVGVSGFWRPLFIFAMASLGACAFANMVQGWALIKNRWYEIPLFLAASFMFFAPAYAAQLLGIPATLRYLPYAFAMVIYAIPFLLQTIHLRRATATVG